MKPMEKLAARERIWKMLAVLSIPLFFTTPCSSAANQERTDPIDYIRKELGYLPTGERIMIEHRVNKEWRELIRTKNCNIEKSLAAFESCVRSVSSQLTEMTSCPSWENRSSWDARETAMRQEYLTEEEFTEYRSRHDSLMLGAIRLAAEYLEMELRVTRSIPTLPAEDREKVLAQFDHLMDVAEELMKPYFPKEPEKLKVVRAVLDQQRKHLKTSGLFLRDKADSGIRQSPIGHVLDKSEVHLIIDKMRTAVAEHGEEIRVPSVTDDLDADLEAFYDADPAPLTTWVIDGALHVSLFEIGGTEAAREAVEKKWEEFKEVAGEHYRLDTRTLHLALDRHNKKNGLGGRSEKSSTAPELNAQSRDDSSQADPKSGDSRPSDQRMLPTRFGGRLLIVLALFLGGGILIIGSWILRRKASA